MRDALIAFWTLVALGMAAWLVVRRPESAPAAPEDDHTGDLGELWRGRHASDDTAEWRPFHTRAAVAHRGRHYVGSRRWSGNLVDATGEITQSAMVQILAEAKAADR